MTPHELIIEKIEDEIETACVRFHEDTYAGTGGFAEAAARTIVELLTREHLLPSLAVCWDCGIPCSCGEADRKHASGS